MENIRHIYFDLDHTLWDFERNSQEVLENMYAYFPCIHSFYADRDTWVHAYRKENDKLWGLYAQGKVQRADLRTKRFADILSPLLDAKVISELANFYLEHTPRKPYLMKNAKEVLTFLQNLDIPVHIITNGFKETQEIKLEYSGIGAFTQELITSEDSGALKPHLKMFNFAVNKIKAKPNEILLIGDSWEADALGAYQAQWNSIWFNPFKQINKEPQKIKDIQCLSDVYAFFS